MISKRRESNVQITQRQLMQPLGPPVPRSKTMGALLTGSPASVVGSGSTSKRNSGVRSGSGGGGSLGENEDEEASPLAARGKTIDQVWEGDKPLPEFQTNVRQVKEAQPYSYWCGRFSALNDRFRMEDISDSSTTLCTDSSSHTNHHPMSPKVDDEERRIRRVFIHLNSLCLTEEAKASLREFQIAFEKKEAKGLMAGVAGDASLREKTSFFDKLMGKRKGSG
ncbi:MAG: hypothetical protein M1830_007442 [Pleopsidium flavum]|nr:MAG: hypothetical protein M1830_007442 [Pleopsidium flavum]